MESHNKKDYERLFKACLTLKTQEECERFFDDLCTIPELNAISQRLKVAGMLRKKMTCQQIAKETGASTATISRISRCLNYGQGGYNLVLERLEEK